MHLGKSAFYLFCALGLSARSAFALSPIEQSLIDKAKYWESRGRNDLAVQSWEKVLQLDPAQPDALVGKGVVDAQEGRTSEAARKLDILQKNFPDHPGIARLSAALRKGKVDTAQTGKELEAARALARAGRNEEAVAAYRRIFGGNKPLGGDALEYYEVLAGSAQGWKEARDGIEQLQRDNPGNPRYSLALARVLSYQEETRREAIRKLSKLASEPAVSEGAKNAWRQSLLWLDGRSVDIPLYKEYLALNPDDKQVIDRMGEILHPPKQPVDAITAERMKAYSELQSGKLQGAEQGFEATLQQRPGDAAALGGLAIIRMKRQQFRQARDLYSQAMKKDPAGRREWEDGYRQASLWMLLKDADAAREHGQAQKAESLLREAIRYDNNRHPALLSLSSLLSDNGKLAEAESGFRHVLKSSPNNAVALKGLSLVLSREGKNEEADKLLATLDAREDLENIGAVKSEMLRAQAGEAEKAGNLRDAKASLEEAMLLDPSSPWTRLSLARVYQKMGEIGQAKSVINGLLDANPDQVDALFALALLLAEEKNWPAALQGMEKIPPAQRTEAMFETQRRFWVNAMVERSVILFRQGKMSDAKEALRQAEVAAGKSGELLGVVASGMADMNDTAHAVSLMRRAISQSRTPSAGLRLRYAGILLRTNQDAELTPLLTQLNEQIATLNPAEKKDLADLDIGLALRRADALREKGDLAAAYDVLAPEMDASPEEPRLQMALARLYASSGDHAKALLIYQEVLAKNSANTDALQAAATEALNLNSLGQAQKLAARAMSLDPDNPRITALAGRIARAQGKNAEALEYFRKALQQERSAAKAGDVRLVSGHLAAPAEKPAVRFNPFAGKGNRADVGQPAVNPDDFADEAVPPVGRRRAYVAPQSDEEYAPPVRKIPARRVAPADESFDDSVAAPARNARSRIFDEDAPVQPLKRAPRRAPARAAAVNEYRQAPRQEPAGEYGQVPAAKSERIETPLEQEIGEMRQQYSTKLAVGGNIRNRNGEAGMSQLLDIEVPLKVEMHPDLAGPLTVSATPVSLSAGDLNLTDPAVARRFGSNSVAAAVTPGIVTQSANGIALGLSYRLDTIKGDVGTSPLGFAVTNLVGGLRWEQKLENGVSVGAEVSRRSVTDSLLSYAGARDPNSGATWGGVVSTGLQLDFGLDGQQTGYYLKAGFHRLTGRNVAVNNKYDISGGAYYYLIRDEDETLTVGANVVTQTYSKNLGFYTLGQGGYFSPQSWFSVGLPIDWTGKNEKLAYELQASLGIQSFRQNASPYFPADAGLQNQLVQLSLVTPGLATTYAASSTTGFGYALSGAVEYQLASKFLVGGRLALDNASNFSQQSGLLYLRYSFLPQPVKAHLPLSPLKPYNLGEAP